jgi:hypothetical protein
MGIIKAIPWFLIDANTIMRFTAIRLPAGSGRSSAIRRRLPANRYRGAAISASLESDIAAALTAFAPPEPPLL